MPILTMEQANLISAARRYLRHIGSWPKLWYLTSYITFSFIICNFFLFFLSWTTVYLADQGCLFEPCDWNGSLQIAYTFYPLAYTSDRWDRVIFSMFLIWFDSTTIPIIVFLIYLILLVPKGFNRKARFGSSISSVTLLSMVRSLEF